MPTWLVSVSCIAAYFWAGGITMVIFCLLYGFPEDGNDSDDSRVVICVGVVLWPVLLLAVIPATIGYRTIRRVLTSKRKLGSGLPLGE